jgi:histidine ammonia-lyase
VLKENNLQPLTLGAKEALALINGTQFMLAHGIQLHATFARMRPLLPILSVLSLDAFDCRREPFYSQLHTIRPHAGQVQVASEVIQLLAASPLASRAKQHVQDPYSFRCIPQVHGASYDALDHCFRVFETELNSVTDNPNVFPEDDLILSGGNFHGQPLALSLDFAAMALAELGAISERRTYLLVSGQRGLPPFLTADAGLDSGFMIAQYSAAALVSQNKQLCTPASVDSIMSSNGQEDHVSMGANAAIKSLKVLENLKNILAIEFLCAANAMDFREEKSAPAVMEKLSAFKKNYPGSHQKIPMHELISYCRNFLFNP